MANFISPFAKVAVLAAFGLLFANQRSEAQHVHHGGSHRGGVFIGTPFFGGPFWGGGWGGGLGGYPFFGPPGRWGLGYGGPGYPMPRYSPYDNISQPINVSVTVNNVMQLPPYYPPAEKGTAPKQDPGAIEVKVPATAVVWVDGKKTQQGGTERYFSTPPLTGGETQTHSIRASWTDQSGAEVIYNRTVSVAANQKAVVDFTTK